MIKLLKWFWKGIKFIFTSNESITKIDYKDVEIDDMYYSHSDRKVYDPYGSNPYPYNPGDKSSYGEMMRDMAVVEPLIDDDFVDPWYYDDVDY